MNREFAKALLSLFTPGPEQAIPSAPTRNIVFAYNMREGEQFAREHSLSRKDTRIIPFPDYERLYGYRPEDYTVYFADGWSEPRPGDMHASHREKEYMFFDYLRSTGWTE